MENVQESGELQLSEQGVQLVGTALDLARQGTLELLDLINIVDRLMSGKQKALAFELYRTYLDHTTSPLAYVACFNFAASLSADGDFVEAEKMNRRALEINPNLIQARLNLGNNLEQLGRVDEALEMWRSALAIESIRQPEHKSLLLHALNSIGRVLETKRKFDESLAVLEESISVDPGQTSVILHLVHLRQKQCMWPVYDPPAGVPLQTLIDNTSPLALLAASNDPAQQFDAARRFVEFKYGTDYPKPLAQAPYRHDKIRVGYLSSDFLLHAVSMLTVELFERHDRERFELHGFCWSREDGSGMRNRVIAAMDHFHKIGGMSDEEAARLIHSHEIDILVDLHGLTSGARPHILAFRPAPVQVTYLGFPGPTGLPWIDYVLADRYLIPEQEREHYSETPLYLPDCFQTSDTKRAIGALPTRAANTLPEDAFVFCSFNNNYKFTPELFAVWMKILKRVPKSVLWLLADNQWAHDNLCRAAEKHGISRERLIFAPRVGPADYLARYQLADIFLDTFPFGGGTTANDALFMGLPILTCAGRTFASRMAGSLLNNMGLSELITANFKEYEERAVKLAKDRKLYARLKARLDEQRSSGSTFDMAKRVRDIEELFIGALEESRKARQLRVVHAAPAAAELPAAAGAGAADAGSAQNAAPASTTSRDSGGTSEASASGRKRLVVYTALIGEKEGLNDPLCAIGDRSATDLEIDYICFTDNPNLTSPTWKMRSLNFPPLPPEKLSRRPKALPHEYLPEYDYSLYIDNTIAFRRLPQSSDLAKVNDRPLFRAFRHPWRKSPLDEADIVVSIGMDSSAVVNAQIEYCSKVKPLGEIRRLTNGTVILREHNATEVIRFGITWWEQILTFSRRDQLSLDFSLDVSGCEIEYFAAEFLNNDFVAWPLMAGGHRIQASFDAVRYAWKNRSIAAAVENPRRHFLEHGKGQDKEYRADVPWLEHVCRREGSSLGSYAPPRRSLTHVLEPLLEKLKDGDRKLLVVRVVSATPLAFEDGELLAALRAIKGYYKYGGAPTVNCVSVPEADLAGDAVYTSAFGISGYDAVVVLGAPPKTAPQLVRKFLPIFGHRGEMLLQLNGTASLKEIGAIEELLGGVTETPKVAIDHSAHLEHSGIIPNSVLSFGLARNAS